MSATTVGLRQASWTERAATTAAFLASGLGIGAWAASIPVFKNALSLSNGALSLALLAFAIGAVLAMQLANLAANKFGTAGGTRIAMLLFAISLLLPPLARSLAALVVAALAMGAAQGLLDVLMNAQASDVERRWGAAIMSSFHAAFSAGGLGGAALGGTLAGATAGRGMELAALASAILVGSAWMALRSRGRPMPSRRRLMLPERALLPLCAAVLLCMLCEGAMGDWSSVYLATVVGTAPGRAAVGYAAFSGTMLIGRLVGDRVVRRVGHARVVSVGGTVATIGLVLAVAFPTTVTSTAGFALVGLGLSNVVPAIYSAAGHRGSTPENGVAMAATAGYAGFLVGPVMIGVTAQVVGLRIGILLLVGCAGAVALLADVVRSVRDS
jgi:MFS family permease